MKSTALMVGCVFLVALVSNGCGSKPDEKPRAAADHAPPPAAEPLETSGPPGDNKPEADKKPMPENKPTKDDVGAAIPATLPPAEAAGEGSQIVMKTPLIPRDVLFGNPDKAAARISPDGTQLSYLAPVNGVLNVWVGPVDKPDEAKPVTKDEYRGIQSYFWAFSSQYLLYTQDIGGDEDFHVYAVDLKEGGVKDLTPLKKVRAEIEGVSEKFPNELLVGLNERDPQYHDVYRVNIATGERTLVQENPDFAGFVTDDEFRVRFALKMMPDGGTQYYVKNDAGEWKDFMKVDMANSLTTSPAGFDKTGDILYMMDSRGRNTGALTSLNLKTGEETVIAADEKADVGGVSGAADGENDSSGELQLLADRMEGDRSGHSGRF